MPHKRHDSFEVLYIECPSIDRLPTCTKPVDQCPWQVNSTGWVRGKGRNYALTVLTTRDPVGGGGTDGFNYGIDTIQNVSQLVWANLGANNRGR